MLQLTWDEIEQSVKGVFHIWMENHWEVRWAKRCWIILKKQGLTGYSCELERHAVIFRLMALAMIYSDFAYKAWREQCNEISIQDMAYDLAVEPFYAGQLAGADPDIDLDSDWQIAIAAKYREEVRNALLKGFGDEAALFVSLWRTAPSDHLMATADILNDVTADKLEAFEWVREGCSR